MTFNFARSSTAIIAVSLGSTAQADSYGDINAVVISDFTGRILVEVADGDVDAQIKDGSKSFAVDITTDDGVLTIDGPDRPRKYSVHDDIDWRKHQENAFAKYLEDYPTLRMSVPKGTAVKFDEAITIASVGDLEGNIVVEGGYVEAIIGNVTNADIEVKGAGEIAVGNVRERLHAGVGGSGDFTALSAATAKLFVGGSGDVTIGPIAGDAEISVGGSGDIDADDIGGSLAASVAGSGNVSIGKIGAGADFAIAGSGDISAASVNGKTSAQISGSGDIEIGGGRAEDLDVSINGSGNFILDGVSTNLHASVNGSGLVEVASNEGSLHTSGRGDFRVGGKRIKNDRH